jgi:hypothetical protein
MDEGDLPGNYGNGSIRCSQNAAKETGRLLSAGSTVQTKDTTKKRFHLVIGESALLIADYFEWVDKVLISR